MYIETVSRYLTIQDSDALTELYRSIAAKSRGLVRMEDEINRDYVEKSLHRCETGGVAIGAFDKTSGVLIGSITTRKLGIKVFEHVLSGLTIGVHPDHQSKGIGRRLFFDFLEHVQTKRADIFRVELFARESNHRQIAFYESIGFRREGTFEKRIRNPDGTFESDIAMGWTKPE